MTPQGMVLRLMGYQKRAAEENNDFGDNTKVVVIPKADHPLLLAAKDLLIVFYTDMYLYYLFLDENGKYSLCETDQATVDVDVDKEDVDLIRSGVNSSLLTFPSLEKVEEHLLYRHDWEDYPPKEDTPPCDTAAEMVAIVDHLSSSVITLDIDGVHRFMYGIDGSQCYIVVRDKDGTWCEYDLDLVWDGDEPPKTQEQLVAIDLSKESKTTKGVKSLLHFAHYIVVECFGENWPYQVPK